MIIPQIVNVAELQKKYREIASRVRDENTPTIVVHNGKPDIVLLSPDSYEKQMKRLVELEEAQLQASLKEAMKEYETGKTVKLESGKTLLDYLK